MSLSTITLTNSNATRTLVILPNSPVAELNDSIAAAFNLPPTASVAIKNSSGRMSTLDQVLRNPSAYAQGKYQLVNAPRAPEKPLGPGSLNHIDPQELVHAFRAHATRGSLSREAFFKVFSKLAPSLTSTQISELFDVFDTDKDQLIDANEFIAGAVVLCGGDRDLKIRLSFDILDTDGNGVLDRNEMEAYMVSVFRVVAHSNPSVFAKHRITPEALAQITVDSAMESADTDRDGVISFDEFRSWMLESGPAQVAALGSLDQIRAETGLGELSADDVVNAFLKEADVKGGVDLEGFKRALHGIVKRTGRDPAKLRPGLAEALFRAVDTDGSKTCDIEELGSAFSVLCSGSRDQRCMAAFEMWDVDGDGYLDADEMAKLLTSVYKVLYASDPKVAKEMGVSPEELGRITAQDAIAQLDTDGDGKLNFSEFRAWYSKPPSTAAASSRAPQSSSSSWVSLEETRRLTGLGRFNPAVVMEAFAVVADSEGMVSHKDFVDTLQHLAPRGLSALDSKRAVEVRERLFELYAEGNRVDFSVLASALAMLSGGQAEDKKRAVFELIDVDCNGTVERDEFLRFMTSTMRVLYETQPGTRERIGVEPEELAAIVTEDAFARFDWNKDSRLTYEEFSAYWEADGSGLAEPNEEVTMEQTRLLLGIDRYHVDDLFEIVAAAADHQGWISLESFDKIMSQLARKDRTLTPQQESQLSRTLRRLYRSFDADNSGSVDFQELAAGLSVLCGGHRDARAEAAFRLFDVEGTGAITLKAMEEYLTAVFKTMIEVGGPEVRQRVGAATPAELARATAEAVFTEADLNADGTLSYSEWQRFYSNESGQALESVLHQAPTYISIAEVKQRTGLDRMSAAECFEHFARAADDKGELSKAAFVNVFAHIAPQPHDARLMLCIDRLFQVLDANGDQKVDYVELSSGLSVLTAGSQKEKLAATFALLDVDGNGTIDLSELERYILSVYRVMYAEPGTRERMGGVSVEDLARMTAEEVMVTANLTHTGELTLSEFEKWIESDGSQLVEPAVRLAAQDKSWMTIPEMARLTNLRSHTSDALFARFQRAANPNGELSRQAFSAVVHQIMAEGARLDTDEALKAEMAVDRLFDALDVNHDKLVDITELSAGISILAGGSRDNKVRSAFKLYDANGDGYISPQEMYQYLVSVYRVLFETQPHVRESMKGVTAEELAKVTTEEAFAQADTNGDGQLSFEEFQAWYSADDDEEQAKRPQQHMRAPARPIAAAPAAKPPTPLHHRRHQHRKPAPSAPAHHHRPTQHSRPHAKQPRRHLPPGKPLDVDTDKVRALTGLGALDAKHALRLVSAHADARTRTLSLAAFAQAIKSIAPQPAPNERELLSSVVSGLFNSLDKNGDGVVDMKELAAGLSVLCRPAPSTSESVSSLFSIFSADGKAVRYEDFETMLESVFTTMLLTDADSRSIARNRSPSELAASTARAIVAQADRNHDGLVSHAEFDAFVNNTEGGRALSTLIRAEQQLSLETLGLDGVRRITGLGTRDAEHVFELVADVCGEQEGELSRQGFQRVLDRLAPTSTDRKELILLGNALFDAIDVDRSNSVSFDEMSAALSILCRGDPHKKAEDFFSLYDLDGDGYISFDELFFYLRSVFRLMNAVTGGSAADDVDLIARATAAEIMRDADVSGDGLISLDEFKQWLAKSPGPRAPGVAVYAGLYDTPINDLGDARRVLGLESKSAEEVFEALASQANDEGEISPAAFEQTLLGFAIQGGGDLKRAKPLIEVLFKKLDLDGNGTLDYSEVAAGLSILTGGDSLEKLRAAFSLYDVSGDGMISKQEMVEYLTSVFSVVMATGHSVPGVTPEQLAEATTEEAFAHADKNRDGLLDFNEFAAWVMGDNTGTATRRIMDDGTAGLSLADIRRITGLEKYHPTTVFEALAMHADKNGELTREAFTRAFSGFAKRNMSEKEARNLRVVLSRVFSLFDSDGNGKVSFPELASGLSVLCNGTKKDKVGAAFSAFGNGDALSQEEVEVLLRSVFKVLLDTVPSARNNIKASPNELAKATAEQMFLECGKPYVTLEEFSNFFDHEQGGIGLSHM